jgi:hypothetical protein
MFAAAGPAAMEEGEVFFFAPAEDDAPREREAVGAAEEEGIVEVAEDGALGDEGAVVGGEVSRQEEVESAEASWGGGCVEGEFTREIATAGHRMVLEGGVERRVRGR